MEVRFDCLFPLMGMVLPSLTIKFREIPILKKTRMKLPPVVGHMVRSIISRERLSRT